ncbi:kinase-like protein [Schizophyllum commune H4-8]|uniref:non-specific serine/threonine protein kinase n=1 Tax=Schizophyllum commune (strain H4-8 / FGSC 9210) TaxID=578458 RepID=D8PL59_SCHCM|nr:kinase-like protein [Schizophyllum commune H4-8]KAI5897527.1 kinase-like protein [Schizophyllum commune H4-8]
MSPATANSKSTSTRPALDALSGLAVKNDRYYLKDLLGSGSYGAVYKALDLLSAKERPKFYAVKCQVKADPTSRRALYQRRESTLHAIVSVHPNIVTLRETVETPDYLFLVMDLCDGHDLFAAIESKAFVGRTELIQDGYAQILDAVAFCHKNGIYHRDLKPENILVSLDLRRLYLTDFGLATRDPDSVTIGCGSGYYMSPECLGSKAFRVASFPNGPTDVWALGVILIAMSSGRLPWLRAELTDANFEAYITNPFYFVEVLPITNSVNAILRRIFRTRPEKRISIGQLKEAVMNLDTLYVEGHEVREFLEMGDPGAEVGDGEVDIADGCVHAPMSPAVVGSESGGDEGSELDDDTDDDSEGVITPETFPVMPQDSVPDDPLDAPVTVKGVANHPLADDFDHPLQDSPYLQAESPLLQVESPYLPQVVAGDGIAEVLEEEVRRMFAGGEGKKVAGPRARHPVVQHGGVGTKDTKAHQGVAGPREPIMTRGRKVALDARAKNAALEARATNAALEARAKNDAAEQAIYTRARASAIALRARQDAAELRARKGAAGADARKGAANVGARRGEGVGVKRDEATSHTRGGGINLRASALDAAQARARRRLADLAARAADAGVEIDDPVLQIRHGAECGAGLRLRSLE